MCAQVSNAHGWHGAQKKARANEQQKQRKQEQEQEQNGGGETGALAADGVEARMSQPLCTHAQAHLV